ncbi:MAG: biopolymer transporter ExbD [Thermoguttaceae bacterium]|nr:biopolymer transporter ExbD [Thermoguttaceae bacterium]
MKRKYSSLSPGSLNMTPMIDIVFLLISFFTLVINFSKAEQHEDVLLPKSELAQPPETVPGELLTFQVTQSDEIFIGSTVCYLDDAPRARGVPFSKALRDELHVIRSVTRTDAAGVTAVVRADENVRTGFVQRLIAQCQEQGMETFVLRARQVRYEE